MDGTYHAKASHLASSLLGQISFCSILFNWSEEKQLYENGSLFSTFYVDT